MKLKLRKKVIFFQFKIEVFLLFLLFSLLLREMDGGDRPKGIFTNVDVLKFLAVVKGLVYFVFILRKLFYLLFRHKKLPRHDEAAMVTFLNLFIEI